MKKIHLPCLRGKFGDWNYFSTLIPIKDVVENKRIITVSESGDLYTKNINEILQREIDVTRISKIKEYLLLNKERFFSSLIVAIHKGNPEWADFDIERQFRIEQEIIDEENTKFIENKLGVLSLNGGEELFVLDGQHRLLGIRQAYADNPEIGDDEISVILVVHTQGLKERTRRLFTVLNRYAEKIKEAEKVILEEDDAAAILTRRLVEEHKMFKKNNSISSTKSFGLPNNDYSNFSTLVCLYQITKVIIDYDTMYKKKSIMRPEPEVLEVLWNQLKKYWDRFFKEFPSTVYFIENRELNPLEFNRNKTTGGSLLLRPNGQKLFAEIFKDYEKEGKADEFWERVTLIDFNLSGPNWNHVFWQGKILTKNLALKRNIFKYLLGDTQLKKKVEVAMQAIYKELNLTYKDEIKPTKV